MRTRTIGFLFSWAATALLAVPPHTLLLKEAAALAKSGDQPAALAKLEQAAKLRPDYPRIQTNLARFYAEAKRPDDALAALQRLADMGITLNLAKDPALTSLQPLPRFQSLATQLATPPAPTGAVAATPIDGVTGILESLLIDATTGTWYFGDVRNRCIWRREAGGTLQRFTAEADELDSVFKLALSPDRKTLWAATAIVGVMSGVPAADGSRSALVALDFNTGRVLSRHPVPTDGRKHLLGDFIPAADGSLFATDSLSPIIWRLPPNGTALEPWLENDDFLNLQGLAFGPDGQTLYVADYSNGIWRIDVATKQAALLTAPPNATFFGIDGLYAVPTGLLAIQNGVNPQRVLLIELSSVGSALGPTSRTRSSQATTLQEAIRSVRPVAAGHPAMTDLSLGFVEGNRFHFIADSGWAIFDPAPENVPPARTLTVLSLDLL